MRKILDSLYFLGGILAAICLLLIVGIILAQITGRIFEFVVPSANKMAGFLMAGVIFLSLAYSFRAGSHIRVELILQFFGRPMKRVINFSCLVVAIGIISFMTWHFGDMVAKSLKYGDMSDGLFGVPLWLPQSVFVVGLGLFAVALIDDAVAVLLNKQTAFERASSEFSLTE